MVSRINRDMKKKRDIILFILLFIVSACAAGEKERGGTAPEHNRTVLAKGYDEVWNALLELIGQDLEYPIEKAEKGVIVTKWISVINVEGTTRWKLEASVEKKKNGTEVEVTKKIQVLEKTSSVPKRGDKEPEPGRGLGGWRTGEPDKIDEGRILSSLKQKLGI